MESILIQKVSITKHADIFRSLWNDHITDIRNKLSSHRELTLQERTMVYTLGRQTGHTTFTKMLLGDIQGVLVVVNCLSAAEELKSRFKNNPKSPTNNLDTNIRTIKNIGNGDDNMLSGIYWEHLILDGISFDKISDSKALQDLMLGSRTITILGGHIPISKL